MATATYYGLRIYNGDTGVVVVREDGLRGRDRRLGWAADFATSWLSDVQTVTP